METDKLIQDLKNVKKNLCHVYRGDAGCYIGCPIRLPDNPCPIQEAILELMRNAKAAEDYEELKKDYERLQKVKEFNYNVLKVAGKERNEAQAKVRQLENELEILRAKIDVLQQENEQMDGFILGLVRMTGNDYTITRHGGYHEISKEVACATALELIRETESYE